MSLATIDQTYSTEILKAIGINDRDPKAQAAVLVCQKYGFDPLLKHVVLIQGSIYVTRDGLLSVAHRSGKLDGIVVEHQGADPTHHIATVSVYRKDMSRPFTYVGRYPKNGGNKNYGPEMAVKCAEVMALRRAFDVSLCAREELWDTMDPADITPLEHREPVKALAPPRQTKSLEAQWNAWLANAAHGLGVKGADLEVTLADQAEVRGLIADLSLLELALAEPKHWQAEDGFFRKVCREIKAKRLDLSPALSPVIGLDEITTDPDADPDFE